MRLSFSNDPSHASALSSRIILVASGALVLSGVLQFATAWVQRHQREVPCSCGTSLPTSPNFEEEYTWLGDDYPPYLPLDLGEPVALTLENSRHFQLDSPDADDEWQTVYPGPNNGFLRLGPHRRFFGISLYHQMHCLESLRQAVNGKSHHHHRSLVEHRELYKRGPQHTSHCLNYLRQTLLCAADLTLEPEIAEGVQNVGQGLAVTHVCRDWSKVHEYVKKNGEDWKEWWASQRANKTGS
ncbi:hypothetical protein PHLCEN_2v1723 [Hermanssonia centrifuga]|uniref:Uncharacterized protein n=1 Tax=Hermanssonia centrifuga TaxID=98765 RepID=A0A2R6RW19_9APHY|nr:hypothetical protein PHLCEN_2v1723 [Hermanssonia centrifuga]